MTVSTLRRLVPAAARLLIAGTVIAGYLAVAHGIADAHDFSLAVGPPTCAEGHKVATVTVTNPWDDSAKITTATMSGGFAPIAAHGTVTLTDTAPASKVGLGLVMTVRLKWDADGFVKDRTYQINWGSETCAGAPATTTTTTVPICPPGQHYSTVPPVGCEGDVAPPSTEVPVTNLPVGTVAPVVTSVPVASTQAAPPVSVTVKKAAAPPTTARIALPATGSNGTLALVGAGLAILAAAVILLLVARRPSES